VAPYADLLDPVFTLLDNYALRAVTSTVTFPEILTKTFADKTFLSPMKSNSRLSLSLRFP